MSDDVDWQAFTRQTRGMTSDECADLRERLEGTSAEIKAVADEYPYSRSCLSKHARGVCSHDHDVPPVDRHALDGGGVVWRFG